MGILSNLLGKGKEKQSTALMLDMLKRGKRPDQCKSIDYLYSPDEEAKKGCLGGKKKPNKKKGGCMSKNVAWDMDDYIAHVQKIVNELGLKQRAIEKIGLDETQISEIPPVTLNSFLYRGDDVVIKSEETNVQGIWRNVSNKYSVTWIFFSATQIYTYTYQFDTTSDNVVESTRDFFYTDVTCIRTEHEIVEKIIERKQGCGCFKKQESKFFHNNQEYDTLSITVPGDSYTFWCKTTETSEQSIQAAKAMIREKKNG